MNAQTALKEILTLPEEERRWLVEEIAATLPEPVVDFELTEEEKTELDRRVADMHAHPEKSIPWKEVKRRVLKQLRHASRRRLG